MSIPAAPKFHIDSPATWRPEVAGPFTGTVVFKISPGEKNNLVNDWAYWGRIEIR